MWSDLPEIVQQLKGLNPHFPDSRSEVFPSGFSSHLSSDSYISFQGIFAPLTLFCRVSMGGTLLRVVAAFIPLNLSVLDIGFI